MGKYRVTELELQTYANLGGDEISGPVFVGGFFDDTNCGSLEGAVHVEIGPLGIL